MAGSPVEKISIQGYKSIHDIRDFELRSLNILIGANGAGKSNFVGFFSLLTAMVRKQLALTVETRGKADSLLHLGPKVTREISGRIFFGQNAYAFTLVPTDDNRLVFSKEEAIYFPNPQEPRPLRFGSGHVESLLAEQRKLAGALGGKNPAWYVYNAVSSWIVYHFHDTSNTALMRREGTARDYEQLRPDAANLAAFLLRLSEFHPDEYELIRSTVQLVAPFFDDFLLRPRERGGDRVLELEWKQKGSDYPFSAMQLSDGTLRFICLATALLQPDPPATVLIDEPELGLHPYALEILSELIRRAASRTQVIISTQSATLLDFFDADNVIVVDRISGATQLRRLSADHLQTWLETYSLGELWRKNVVEGVPVHE